MVCEGAEMLVLRRTAHTSVDYKRVRLRRSP